MPTYMLLAVAGPAIMANSGSTAADITTFTSWATSLVTWLVTTMGTFLDFLLAHPIALVGLVLSLVVTAAGMLRRMIGG